MTSTLISFVGRDEHNRDHYGHRVISDSAVLSRFVRSRFDKGWRCLDVRDLDHGRQSGAITRDPGTDERIWWAEQ